MVNTHRVSEMLDFLEIPRATQSRRPPHVAFQDLIHGLISTPGINYDL